jgi:hypothetical protein
LRCGVAPRRPSRRTTPARPRRGLRHDRALPPRGRAPATIVAFLFNGTSRHFAIHSSNALRTALLRSDRSARIRARLLVSEPLERIEVLCLEIQDARRPTRSDATSDAWSTARAGRRWPVTRRVTADQCSLPPTQEDVQFARTYAERQADAASRKLAAFDERVDGRPRHLEASRDLRRCEKDALRGPRHRRAKRRRPACVRWFGMRAGCSRNARDFRWMGRGATLCFAVENPWGPLGCKWSLVQIQSPRHEPPDLLGPGAFSCKLVTSRAASGDARVTHPSAAPSIASPGHPASRAPRREGSPGPEAVTPGAYADTVQSTVDF